MAEVILIHVPIILNRRGEHWLDTLADESSNYPMGLLYIGGYLEQHDIEVKVLDVTPGHLTLEDILGADEVFFTGTASEVTPIRSIEDNLISNGTPGDITLLLRKSYMDIVFGKNDSYSNWLSILNYNPKASSI